MSDYDAAIATKPNAKVVYGPPGCGKSTIAEAMAEYLGCTKANDDWQIRHAIHPQTLNLTSLTLAELEANFERRHGTRAEILSFWSVVSEMYPYDPEKVTDPFFMALEKLTCWRGDSSGLCLPADPSWSLLGTIPPAAYFPMLKHHRLKAAAAKRAAAQKLIDEADALAKGI